MLSAECTYTEHKTDSEENCLQISSAQRLISTVPVHKCCIAEIFGATVRHEFMTLFHLCSNLTSAKTNISTMHRTILIPIFTVYLILAAVPDCSSDHPTSRPAIVKANSAVCSMKELDVCGPNQLCVQGSPGEDYGICECMQGYVEQDDGVRRDDETLKTVTQLLKTILRFRPASRPSTTTSPGRCPHPPAATPTPSTPTPTRRPPPTSPRTSRGRPRTPR